jgi:hypothetical protein
MTGLTLLTATSGDSSSSLNPTILLTWLTCLITLGGFVLASAKYGRKIIQMVEDFNGTTARPGVPQRPGVMARLQTLDERVDAVHTEVNYNHGTTIKDAITRIESDVKGIHEKIDKQP